VAPDVTVTVDLFDLFDKKRAASTSTTRSVCCKFAPT
jgi:hypothetical protein